jgi:hypothetical protein
MKNLTAAQWQCQGAPGKSFNQLLLVFFIERIILRDNQQRLRHENDNALVAAGRRWDNGR